MDTLMIYRLFIEYGQELDTGAMETLAIFLGHIHHKPDLTYEAFFDSIIVGAVNDSQATWDRIKLSDEIYMDTALYPLFGGSDMGSPMLFNAMMHKAIEEKVIGKQVYIFRTYRGGHLAVPCVRYLQGEHEKQWEDLCAPAYSTALSGRAACR